jgi:hypothetical protein
VPFWYILAESLASPLQILIDASNGASDYGNKFGEPLVAGYCRTFGQRLPNGERREWIKPIMFSGGIGQIDHRWEKGCAAPAASLGAFVPFHLDDQAISAVSDNGNAVVLLIVMQAPSQGGPSDQHARCQDWRSCLPHRHGRRCSFLHSIRVSLPYLLLIDG